MNNALYSTEINQYILYEKAEHSLYERHCIDGKTLDVVNVAAIANVKSIPVFSRKSFASSTIALQNSVFTILVNLKKKNRHFKKRKTDLR